MAGGRHLLRRERRLAGAPQLHSEVDRQRETAQGQREGEDESDELHDHREALEEMRRAAIDLIERV